MLLFNIFYQSISNENDSADCVFYDFGVNGMYAWLCYYLNSQIPLPFKAPPHFLLLSISS